MLAELYRTFLAMPAANASIDNMLVESAIVKRVLLQVLSLLSCYTQLLVATGVRCLDLCTDSNHVKFVTIVLLLLSTVHVVQKCPESTQMTWLLICMPATC